MGTYGGKGFLGLLGLPEVLDEHEVASRLLERALQECTRFGGADTVDQAATRRQAEKLLHPDSPVSARVVLDTTRATLASYLAGILRAGWGPTDLGEVTRRRCSAEHLPLLSQVLAEHASHHPEHLVAPVWRAELAALGPAGDRELRIPVALARALGLMVLLVTLPGIQRLIPPPGAPQAARAGAAASGGSAVDTKMLGKVRAMLAKAESTEFPDEAEAFSAKAQELISRYSLKRLVAAADTADGAQGTAPVARRIWIDSPYVLPKAMLVDSVARANRCSAVVSEQVGFSTVVGAPADLDAVELLTTSLLVQASSAMLRAGPSQARNGTSHTASYRRSFLIAYAHRVGERLREATRAAAESTGRGSELVPLLARHSQRVAATVEEMFPHVVSKATPISNPEGWAAGRAAADLAQLNSRPQVPRRTG